MTQFKPVFRHALCLIAVLGLVPGHAHAGAALEAAQAKRANAFNDFYKQYLKLKNVTPERIVEIRNRTIEPATETLQQALAQENSDALSRLGVKTITESEMADMRKHEKKMAGRTGDASVSGDKAGGRTSGKSGGKDGAPSSLNFDGKGYSPGDRSGDAGKAPEVKIDGSKIPSSIQFQKKQKPKVDEDD